MRTHWHKIAAAAIGSTLIIVPPASGQEPDAKTQSDLATAELGRLKTMQDMILANKGTAEGKATVTDMEAGAEVLRLQNVTEAEAARRLAEIVGDGKGRPIVVAFGASPPTVAHYLAIKHGVEELRHNTDETLTMARQVFDKSQRGRAKLKSASHRGTFSAVIDGAEMGDLPAFGPASVGLSAISTVISLLRVDTDLKGKMLTSRPAVLGPQLSYALANQGWRVAIPDPIATRTTYADGIVKGFQDDRDALSQYYALYLARVQAAPDGKVEKLPEDVRIAGKALETALGDHHQLVVGLYTPVEGVLPAAVVEEEKRLADLLPSSALLMVNGNDVALTSMTQKGALTGLFGSVPAHASATSVLTYTLVDGGQSRFGSVAYQTPMIGVRNIAGWADQADVKRRTREAQARSGVESSGAIRTGH